MQVRMDMFDLLRRDDAPSLWSHHGGILPNPWPPTSSAVESHAPRSVMAALVVTGRQCLVAMSCVYGIPYWALWRSSGNVADHPQVTFTITKISSKIIGY